MAEFDRLYWWYYYYGGTGVAFTPPHIAPRAYQRNELPVAETAIGLAPPNEEPQPPRPRICYTESMLRSLRSGAGDPPETVWRVRDVLLTPKKHIPPAGKGSPLSSSQFVSRLGREVWAFAEWILPTADDLRDHQTLCSRVQHILSEVCDTAKVDVFGSSTCGLMLPSSDLDFVVEGIPVAMGDGDRKPTADKDEPPSNVDQRKSKESSDSESQPTTPTAQTGLQLTNGNGEATYTAPQLVTIIADLLRQHGMANVTSLPRARTPVVKFFDPVANLNADMGIGVNIPNARKSTTLMQKYLSELPVAGPLILAVKSLLRQHGLNTVHLGGIGSYATALLVITFLRGSTKKKKKEGRRPKAKAVGVHLSNYNLGWHLLQFLKYFSTHHLRTKFNPEDGEETPLAPTSPTSPKAGSEIYIVDPLDPTNDITRGCYRFHEIQQLFGHVVHLLTDCYQQSGPRVPCVISNVLDLRELTLHIHAQKRIQAMGYAPCAALAEGGEEDGMMAFGAEEDDDEALAGDPHSPAMEWYPA